MDCSPPGPSIHGIFQARVLEWVAIAFSVMEMVNIKIRLIIFFAAEDGEALCSQQTQDWELTVAQIMNSFTAKLRCKLKKVEKTTRPFRYGLNQIPYDYTVEVINRFKD